MIKHVQDLITSAKEVMFPYLSVRWLVFWLFEWFVGWFGWSFGFGWFLGRLGWLVSWLAVGFLGSLVVCLLAG